MRHTKIFRTCDFANDTASDQCLYYVEKSFEEIGNIDINNIYAPICLDSVLKNGSTSFVRPCNTIPSKYIAHLHYNLKEEKGLYIVCDDKECVNFS